MSEEKKFDIKKIFPLYEVNTDGADSEYIANNLNILFKEVVISVENENEDNIIIGYSSVKELYCHKDKLVVRVDGKNYILVSKYNKNGDKIHD